MKLLEPLYLDTKHGVDVFFGVLLAAGYRFEGYLASKHKVVSVVSHVMQVISDLIDRRNPGALKEGRYAFFGRAATGKGGTAWQGGNRAGRQLGGAASG